MLKIKLTGNYNMCGIWGAFSRTRLDYDDKKYLKYAMIAGTVRGMDGTGVIEVQTNGETQYAKKAVTGSEMCRDFYNPDSIPVSGANGVKSLIGHNRAATVGNISDETSHPFISKNIIGVHNGTLDTGWAADLGVRRNTPVDSMGLFKSIAAYGIKETIKNAHGAIAIVYHDMDTDTTYIYRNTERVLHYLERNGTTYIASEAKMCEWLVEKAEAGFYSNYGTVNTWDSDTATMFKAYHLYSMKDGVLSDLGKLDQPRPKYTAPANSNTGATNSAAVTAFKHKDVIPFDRKPTVRTVPNGQVEARTDMGIPYAGLNVSKADEANGIVAEWVERGNESYTCMCCEHPVMGTYYEGLDGATGNGILLHESCLDDFRSGVSADEPLRRIKRQPLSKNTGANQ